jgi:hypothetical protein
MRIRTPTPGKFRNEKPIKDPHEILRLLEGSLNDRTRRTLWLEGDVAFIEVESFGREMGHHMGVSYYSIDPRLAENLKIDGLVDPTPHMGYTAENELRINKRGREEYYKPLLKPGTAAASK